MAIPALTNLTANTTARAADVIGNDNVIRDHYNANAVEKSGAQSIAGVKTFSDIPVFSNGATVTAGGVTISSGGLTATGNSTITGTLTALTGLTSSGTASLATVTVSGSLTLTGGSAIGKRVDDGSLQRRRKHPRGSESWVTGKRKLGGRGEDAHPSSSAVPGRQHESCFREADLLRKRLHGLCFDAPRIREDRQLVAC